MTERGPVVTAVVVTVAQKVVVKVVEVRTPTRLRGACPEVDPKDLLLGGATKREAKVGEREKKKGERDEEEEKAGVIVVVVEMER